MKNLKKVILMGVLALSIMAGGYGGFRAFADNEEVKQNENGKVVYSFKTQAEAEKIVGKLKEGKKYILREKKAAKGYVRSKDIEFTVNSDGKEQEIKVVNDYTKVEISKTDITGEKEIPGAKLKVVKLTEDKKEGEVIESWTSEEKAHRIDKMEPGKYRLIEEQAPDGYVIASAVDFEVKETGEVQKVVMKDDTTKVKVTKVGSDDETKQLEGCEFDIIEVEESDD